MAADQTDPEIRESATYTTFVFRKFVAVVAVGIVDIITTGTINDSAIICQGTYAGRLCVSADGAAASMPLLETGTMKDMLTEYSQ